MPNLGPTATAALAVVVALLVGGILVYLARRRMSSDGGNENSTEERIAHREARQDYHLPLRAKYRLMHPGAKIMTVGMFVVLGVIMYEIYTYMKTGSPTQHVYSQFALITVATLVGSVLGFKYGRGVLRGEGYVAVEYEATPDNDRSKSETKLIPFGPDDVHETEDGKVVHEQTQGRIYGIWRRAKTVVEDRELRGQNRPDDDKIGHLIPDRAVEIKPNVWHFRTKGKRTIKDPTAVADVTYRPSFSMSNREKMQVSSDLDMLETANEELRVRLANAHREIVSLEDELEMVATRDWQELIQRAKDLTEISGNAPMYHQYAQMNDQNAHHANRKNGRESNLDELREILNGDGSD
jgi:hypothetical protein